jgi:cytochrome b involved in lipid metabolism
MILGLTIVAIALATFFLVQSKDGKMSSYVWGLFGYAPEEKKDEDVTARTRNKSGETGTVTSSAPANGQAEAKSPRRSEDEGDSTPKAKAKEDRVLPPVPLFTLQAQNDADDEDDEEEDNLPPPSFPALNSAQRASVMPPPRIPTLNPPSSNTTTANGLMAPPSRPNGLMAPPSRPVPSLRPSPANGLRVPTTGPLPNRNPTASTSSSSSLATPITAATSIPNPRKKVLLAPGHSPLDWANLKRTSTNLSGVPRLLRVTPSMLKSQNGRKGKPAWSSYQGKVYNLSPYLPYHPGGEGELRRAAGKEGGKLFNEVHPWVNWENMLEGCLVGIMVSEGDGEKESELDEMD